MELIRPVGCQEPSPQFKSINSISSVNFIGPAASELLNLPSMSFSLRLSPDLLAVEAGATTPLALNVSGKGEAREQIEIQVEGLDPEWLAIPEPMFNVEPGEDHIERIFFKPSRVSESLAGNYPFVVRARSLDSGETKTAAGVLQIKPYNHLAIEIGPKKGYYSKYRKSNTFSVTVMNLGNTEHTVQLFGSDPDDECAYDFDQETFVLAPGQSKAVDVSVTPKSERTFAGSRLFGFSISARSTVAPSVAASAQAQLEQRPMLSPGTIVAGVFALVIFLAWFALLPKPPTVTLTVSPSAEVAQGEPVHISWESNSRVQIKVNGMVWQDDAPTNPAGIDFKTVEAGQLTVEAIPYRDQKLEIAQRKSHVLNVVAPPVIPEPEIALFEAQSRSVNLGESVLLRYKFNSAVTRAKLAPSQQDLDVNVGEIQVMPTTLGPTTYTLLAYNSANKSVSKKVVVNVHERVDVTIDSFDVNPTGPVPLGESVTLSWRVSKSSKVQIVVNGVAQDIPAEGSRSFPVQGPTVAILLATDDKGHTVQKKKVIQIQAAVPTPDPSASPPPDGTNAGGQR